MILKYELNELGITLGSLIMMSFSLMEVLGDLWFLPKMVLMLDHTFFLFPKELSRRHHLHAVEQYSICNDMLLLMLII